jgi:phosphate transport system substrate-binding protein
MMLRSAVTVAALAALSLALPANAQQARDQIRAAGSSTVFPFTTTVAENFARAYSGKFKSPIVESIGTGGGFKEFCKGVGTQFTDIANASRAINKNEMADCAKNGVKEITEIKIGFDGLTVATKKGSFQADLTREQIWKALAKEVVVDGKVVANPYKQWSDIDASLPKVKIEAYGPPPTSGTRDSFVELVMDIGCKKPVEAVDKSMHKKLCGTMREDGHFIEAGENDNLIVQKIASSTTGAVGIFGYSFLDQNADKIEGVSVEGVKPVFENIASGKYSVARPLFVYIKNAHVGVVPGMKEFVAEFVSEKSYGPNGYLVPKGLVSLPEAERKTTREQATGLKPMMM